VLRTAQHLSGRAILHDPARLHHGDVAAQMMNQREIVADEDHGEAKLASQFDQASTVFITAGRKAAQFVARTQRQLIAEFPYGDSPVFAEARAIATFARDLFLKKEVDEVKIIATRFVNTLTQEPVIIEYLPAGEIKSLRVPGVEPIDAHATDDEIVFEPGAEEVLGYLLGIYLNVYLYYVLLMTSLALPQCMPSFVKRTIPAADSRRHRSSDHS